MSWNGGGWLETGDGQEGGQVRAAGPGLRRTGSGRKEGGQDAFMVDSFGLNAKGPAVSRAFSLFLTYYFQYTKRTITHLPCRGVFDLVWFEGCGRVLHRCGGLTTFWADRVVRGLQAHISRARCGAPGCLVEKGHRPSESCCWILLYLAFPDG